MRRMRLFWFKTETAKIVSADTLLRIRLDASTVITFRRSLTFDRTSRDSSAILDAPFAGDSTVEKPTLNVQFAMRRVLANSECCTCMVVLLVDSDRSEECVCFTIWRGCFFRFVNNRKSYSNSQHRGGVRLVYSRKLYLNRKKKKHLNNENAIQVFVHSDIVFFVLIHVKNNRRNRSAIFTKNVF